MKTRFWIALPLAATLVVPAVAQQNSPSQDQNQPTVQQQQAQPMPGQAQASEQKPADQGLSARQPLQQQTHEGFWGKINPFARKKYVQRQLSPVRDRVNELDELTAQNAKNIKDVDARAQQGIQLASNRANEADMHAVDAGNRAQAAQQTANQASTRLQTLDQVVTNIDQYKPVNVTEIRLRPGQTMLSKKAKDALDQMSQGLKDQKGYIIEVQGFSAGRGMAAIESSQRMAEAVRRYLVIDNNVPVYRVHVLGLGSARPASAEEGTAKRVRGAHVDVSLLKNDLEQLSSAQPIATPAASTAAEGGVSGTATSAPAPAPANQPAATQPASNMNAPASPSTPTPNAVPPAAPPQQSVPPQQ